uniref:Protein NLRC3 n=1 Tax=Macrostomum lignano TaxID=282301 RepID=A0A1I8FF22_9PLAT
MPRDGTLQEAIQMPPAEDEDLPEAGGFKRTRHWTGPQHPQNHRGGSGVEPGHGAGTGRAQSQRPLQLRRAQPSRSWLNKAKLLKRLPVDVSRRSPGPLIRDESYWRARVQSAVAVLRLRRRSWKRMHYERDLQEVIEFFVPGSTDPTQLSESLILAGPFVRRLVIKPAACRRSPTTPPVRATTAGSDHGSDAENELGQQPPGLRTAASTAAEPHGAATLLHRPRLRHELRMEPLQLHRQRLPETRRSCGACRQLRVLQLSRSKVDCDRCRILISRLLDHPGLEELDLSPTTASEIGGALVRLDVTDNLVRAQGAQALAHALLQEPHSATAQLRLNRMGDDGGQAIGKALIRQRHPGRRRHLQHEADGNRAGSGDRPDKTLQRLNLCNNRLGADGGKQLQEGMEREPHCTELQPLWGDGASKLAGGGRGDGPAASPSAARNRVPQSPRC